MASCLSSPALAQDVQCERALKGAKCTFVDGPVRLTRQPVKIAPEPQDFFRLEKGLGFRDSAGREWVAPPETFTDGASIPEIFIPLIGKRRSRTFINAATIHDAYCGHGNEGLAEYKSRHWEDVHRMFYDALVVNGTSKTKARIMFAAVYLGGPRWGDRSRDMSSVSRTHMVQEMEWCIRWIKRMKPSRERIVDWMKSREANLRANTPQEPDWKTLFAEGKSRSKAYAD
ncbi:DUF1353 domain-containing protein [uncultured Roseovarius sp.]|uniref:DUF1353 domain-containing protein n=1 Tax=uncultured Roseovarius sp. TaxID=293344 RepID=UPI0026261ABA|nr:DUF1353 domain-containing protein [uncultured Roseovarius sp.]